ncbi:MAG: sodium:calcium antiporter [Bacteroidia bacterium]|nr:sodium:calcium antiporter [Bacteroidia bacterium]
MLNLLLIIIGLVGLWIGSDMVIKGAVNIAKYYNLSHVFIGLAILSIGTDLPEVIITINASLHNTLGNTDTSGIIIGNAIGSSISQISIVLGIVGFMGYIILKKRHLYIDGTMLLGTIIMVALLGVDGRLSRMDGIVLIIVYSIYYVRLFHQEKVARKLKKEFGQELKRYIFLLILGLALLIFASELVVNNALIFSDQFGLRQSFVGIMILGLGSSLPELAIAIKAIRKKAGGLSVGNIIGSNIFDMSVPIGLGATIAEVNFEKELLQFDLPYLFVLSFLVLIFFYKKKGLQRIEAVVLICIFIFYSVLKFIGF